MRYLALISIFMITSCSYIQSFNDWADSIMPRQSDFKGGSKTVYQTQPANNSSYSQPANPGYVRPDQPNPIAPGGAFNSPGYQDPYASNQGAAQQEYTPPVNNLPPVNGAVNNAPPRTEDFQRDYWDQNIPRAPIGY